MNNFIQLYVFSIGNQPPQKYDEEWDCDREIETAICAYGETIEDLILDAANKWGEVVGYYGVEDKHRTFHDPVTVLKYKGEYYGKFDTRCHIIPPYCGEMAEPEHLKKIPLPLPDADEIFAKIKNSDAFSIAVMRGETKKDEQLRKEREYNAGVVAREEAARIHWQEIADKKMAEQERELYEQLKQKYENTEVK